MDTKKGVHNATPLTKQTRKTLLLLLFLFYPLNQSVIIQPLKEIFVL